MKVISGNLGETEVVIIEHKGNKILIGNTEEGGFFIGNGEGCKPSKINTVFDRDSGGFHFHIFFEKEI